MLFFTAVPQEVMGRCVTVCVCVCVYLCMVGCMYVWMDGLVDVCGGVHNSHVPGHQGD